MNIKKLTVWTVLGTIVIAFLFGMNKYQRGVQESQEQKATEQVSRLVRMHSPVFGPQDAKVTIVEFFDPACEACRAFYPFVKDLLRQYPNDVRLVLRYAPFHQGSSEVVKILDAAKRQGNLLPVLEAVLQAQPLWATHHGSPKLEVAYKAAESAGLDLQKALNDAQTPQAEAMLKQEIEDLTSLEVKKTPTFFVNGRTLASFGPDQLAALVAQEVGKSRK